MKVYDKDTLQRAWTCMLRFLRLKYGGEALTKTIGMDTYDLLWQDEDDTILCVSMVGVYSNQEDLAGQYNQDKYNHEQYEATMLDLIQEASPLMVEGSIVPVAIAFWLTDDAHALIKQENHYVKEG